MSDLKEAVLFLLNVIADSEQVGAIGLMGEEVGCDWVVGPDEQMRALDLIKKLSEPPTDTRG